ncbi:pulmonary surfactant-associated protein D-like [Portunus trituberculatus]|uniref:pulmonary surfactant-associated protein D-like n=1 Tax=Portunus trituberculatus TaxID=210409 RepID=UPI001E1D1EE9|nr:pulmonary surfactant-associated protein D-like [Portunus trituberculatus]
MFHPRAPQALALVPVVVTLLVAETHSHPTQHVAQQIIKNDFGAAQLGLSIVINQMALLRILNESSILSTTPTSRKTYRVYEHLATQSQAVQACQQLGGRLALPTNEAEEKEVTKLIGITFDTTIFSVYWISVSDEQAEGNMIDIVTGQHLSYTNFEPGQPDDAGGGEDCVHKSANFRGWNDHQCTHKGDGYVCEFMDV